MRYLSIILLSFMFSISSIASEHYSGILENGNEAYKTENYDDAITAYEHVLSADYSSAAVYYNLGNSYYKTGQLPDAILHYEKALKIDPSNSDIQYNLSIANRQITDKLESIPPFFLSIWWKNASQLLSIDSWGWLTVSSMFFGALLFGFFWQTKTETSKKSSFYGFIVSLTLAIFCFFAGNDQKNILETSTEAIVFSPSLTVKSSPVINSKELFVVHEGIKVKILESIDNWYKVSISDGNTGWIKKTTVEQI